MLSRNAVNKRVANGGQEARLLEYNGKISHLNSKLYYLHLIKQKNPGVTLPDFYINHYAFVGLFLGAFESLLSLLSLASRSKVSTFFSSTGCSESSSVVPSML